MGDLAVDSQLASSQSVSGVRELLNGCICCNLVGQLSDALFELRGSVSPDRVIIETSGSAFPATLAMEVNRLARENVGTFVLDGVISVIDVENWKGYDDTSVTAKMQAKYTDLIVYNKWEVAGEDKLEICRDRVGDLDVQIAWVKSIKGWVDAEVVMGIDGGMVNRQGAREAVEFDLEHAVEAEKQHLQKHNQDGRRGSHHHQSEVEVLSVTLISKNNGKRGVDIDAFEELLLSAPKDEVYRIKGLILSATPPPDSTGERRPSLIEGKELYVLNWAFGRWTYTALPAQDVKIMEGAMVRLTFILARGEAPKWTKRLQQGDLIQLEGEDEGTLEIKQIS